MNESGWVWLAVEAAVDLQEERIEEHGDARGLRDENGVHAALARPQPIATYEDDADVFRLAAAHVSGLTRNHPFVDGNKRMAFRSHVQTGVGA